MHIPLRNLVVTVVLILALSACGGGGSGNGNKGGNDEPPVVVLSSDASLSSLSTSAGSLSPAFQPSQLQYDLAVGASVSSLRVTAATTHANATVTINGNSVTSGVASPDIELVTGDNTITVTVTAENGTASRSHTVTVRRLNDDATLASLDISSGSLSPNFAAGVLSYTVEVAASVNTVTLTPVLSDANASVSIDGTPVTTGSVSGPIDLSASDTNIEIVVEAEDESATQTYTLMVHKIGQNAYLSGLVLSTGAMDQAFSANLFSYTQTTTSADLTVTPTLQDVNATVEVNGSIVQSGQASSNIALAIGGNSIDVQVTAEDGTTVENYSVTVTRLSSTVSLTGLSISPGTLEQAFQPAIYTYTASTGFLQTRVQVTADASAGVSIEIDGVAATSGQPGPQISLDEGTNEVTVAATSADGNASETYTITIIRNDVSTFDQQAYIKADSPDPGDMFGHSVALDGDTLAVGAYGDDTDNDPTIFGAVFVFTRDAAGTWARQAYLKPLLSSASFGQFVALSGDTLAISGRSPLGRGVYIFVRDANGVWAEQAFLYNSISPGFGTSTSSHMTIAIDGDTLLVGDYWDRSGSTGVNGDQTDVSAEMSGAAYVFVRTGTNWSQQAYLKASNTESNDTFGFSVALDGDTAAVGAYQEDSSATGVNGNQADNGKPRSGAAYVFTRNDVTWSQQAYLKASNPDNDDMFGFSIALSGDTLTVGAISEDSAATGIDGNQANNATDWAGAAYVFARDGGGNWSQQAYVKPSITQSPYSFARWVAVDGDTLVIGSEYEASSSTGINADQSCHLCAFRSGAVYIFTRDAADNWTQRAFAKASNAEAYDDFGYAFAIDGDTLAVGALGEDSAATGIGGNQADNSLSQAGAVYILQ